MTASVPPAPDTEATPPDDTQTGMTHRQRINALVGLLLGMFVAFLSSTIVSNALPTIIMDLHGTQDQYTWVVTATLLASTATTPIWGKFADLVLIDGDPLTDMRDIRKVDAVFKGGKRYDPAEIERALGIVPRKQAKPQAGAVP